MIYGVSAVDLHNDAMIIKSTPLCRGASDCRKIYIIFKNGVWGVAPSGVRAAAPHSAPARTPGVYAQRLYARTHTSGRTKSVQDAPTINDHDCTDAEPTKHTQPFTTGKGFSARMPK